MIGFERPFCIGCGYTKKESSMAVRLGNLGFCTDCAQTIHTTKDMTFQGREFVDIVISPFLYDGIIGEAVREFKFFGQKLYGSFLAALAVERFERKNILADCDIVVPVPLHKKRFEERGYNQSEIIAKRIAMEIGKEMDANSLIRIRDTSHQSRLSGYKRIENVKDAFLSDEENIYGKRILLIDDIYTMGETANQCAKALKAAGADSVKVFTLCKTIKSSLL